MTDQRNAISTAYAMAKQGYRPEVIIETTGLDAKQVKELITKAKRS